MLCCPSRFVRAEDAPLVVYVAERYGGEVRLAGFTGGEAVAVAPELEQARWRRFGLRGQSPNRPRRPGSVVEMGGDFPRLQVRNEYQIVAFSNGGDGDDGPEGIAVVGPLGTHVLLVEPGMRFRPVPDGAFVSPDHLHLAVMVHGTEERETELFVLNLQPELPTVCSVRLPPLTRHLEPESLTLIDGAVLVAARFGAHERVLLKAPLERDAAVSIDADLVAGPFAVLKPAMAYSQAAVVFLAGENDERLDVHVARASGESFNLTRLPAPYLVHQRDDQRLCVSDDGSAVGYSIEMEAYGPEPETFCHPVAMPGAQGRVHLTADERFQPYVEQEVIIFFRGNFGLVFSAGHRREMNFFLFSEISSATIKNLTGTGDSSFPYGLGTLDPKSGVATGSGLLLLAADGFDGESGIVGVSGDTGEEVFRHLGPRDPKAFFEVGRDVYFVASANAGSSITVRWLFRVRGSELATIGATNAWGACQLLVHEPRRALYYLEGKGLLELRPGAEPSMLIAEDIDPAVGLSPCGDHLVFSRGGEYFDMKLSDGVATPLSGAPAVRGCVMAVGNSFLRGDPLGDERVGLEDLFAILDYLFAGESLECRDAADADDDGDVTVSDVVEVMNHLYLSGVPLAPPFQDPGVDPTPDDLSCCR